MMREILHKLGFHDWEYLGETDDIKRCNICGLHWLDGGDVDYTGRASNKLEVEYLLMGREKERLRCIKKYEEYVEKMKTELKDYKRADGCGCACDNR